jgi:hypothetical protein
MLSLHSRMSTGRERRSRGTPLAAYGDLFETVNGSSALPS